MPGYKGIYWYDLIRIFWQQVNDGLSERASAISFNFIMAIPAACIFLFTLVPYLPVSKQFNTELLNLTSDLTPNHNTYLFVKGFLDDFFNKKRNGLLSFGFILVVYYASSAMIGIIQTFDRSINEAKGFFLYQRWRAIRLTLILVLLLFAAILILIGQEQLASLLKAVFHLKHNTRAIWLNSVRWLVIVALLFYGVGLIYKFAPSVKKRWPVVSYGSVLATILLVSTTAFFSFWVNNFSSYNKVYGSIGTVLIIMLLVYLNSYILLIGFELNVSLTQLQQQLDEPVKEVD